MDNLNSPAYPHQTWEEIAMNRGDNQIAHSTSEKSGGFTKLELASLMIAQGLATRKLFEMLETKNYPSGIAKLSVVIAKAVLEEANK